MFGPLSFSSPREEIKLTSVQNSSKVISCFLCESQYNLALQQDDFLQHIFNVHKLVIADVHLIADLDRYVSYWKMRLQNNPLKDFCSTVLVDVEKDNQVLPNQQYFLLSDVLPEDKQLREGLQQQKLEWALEQQKLEREDKNFSRVCLFCNNDITGTRVMYLDHLASQHNLQLGHPHNLVFIDELIDKLQEKIERLQCIFCEKVFKDRTVLKEHMRKKNWHKRINPENKEYDRFYIVNYLEAGKSWKEHQDVKLRDISPGNEDAEWSDWTEDTGDAIVCLLCPYSGNSWDHINTHMLTKHGFHYEQLTAELDFYQQVKLVNYIRRQVHRLACIICDKKLESQESLLIHMTQTGHLSLPHCLLWDQPEYYFPTYENDLFLCQIEDSRDVEEEELKEKMVSEHLSENEELIKKFQKLICDS